MVATPIKPGVTPVAEIDTDALIATFLNQLGEPQTQSQTDALEAFKVGQADVVRVAAATNLDDPFCKALGYMVSIPKRPPTLAVLLAESARAIADWQRARTVAELERTIATAFGQ